VNRRLFLQASAATGIGLSLGTAAHAAKGGKLVVGVAGGGIVGAAIAMELARRGARVILFEKDRPGSGATAKSLAWINALVADPHYARLRARSVERWRELDRPLGLGVTWGGSLNWTNAGDEREEVDSQGRSLIGTPSQVAPLTAADVRRIDPASATPNFVTGYFSPTDGHVDGVHATNRMLAQAQKTGARVIFPCEVKGMEFAAGRLAGVQTTQGRFALDRLVVASGVDTPALLSRIGYSLTLRHRPGALVHCKPRPIVTKLAYGGPGGSEWKQMSDGSFVGGIVGGPPSYVPDHGAILSGETRAFPDGYAEVHGAHIMQMLSAYLPAMKDAEFDYTTLGFRPMPTDGMPVCGPVPGASDVYTCVTHSGVSLAMILGDYVAGEVVTGKPHEMLAPYRPERFGAKPAQTA